MTLEIHGLTGCPFAWRTRIAARLKGVAFDWLPHDVATPDERVAAHNPDKRSPLLWDDGFVLVESTIVAQYLDESRSGRALQPSDARERAQARLGMVEMGTLMLPHGQHLNPSQEVQQKVLANMPKLERRLADGRAFVDGDAPGLVDAHAWPSLAMLVGARVEIPAEHAKVRGYWERARAHEAYAATKTPWAP